MAWLKFYSMDIPILKSVIILFAIAVVVVLISKRLHIPVIIGYLLTGMVAGPHGLGLVTNLHDIDMLAEIGIILLLFSIGIEFSLQKFIRMKAMVLGGGMIQVVLTICLVFLVAGMAGCSGKESWFIGMLLALSSTAIVIRVIQESGAIDSPRGRTSLAILIFQDLAIIPMILVLPILAGRSSGGLNEIALLVIKVVGVTAVVLIGARKLVPLILLKVARTQSNELFLLTVIVIAFAVAWLTSLVGLSLA
ncbi:MAG: potassium transporter KefB, partial [Bacteroidetes bacterium HGW-Bacteroidetes-22]